MNILERIAALRARQENFLTLGTDLSAAAETAGRSLSDAELAMLTSYREQAEAIGREIEQLLPLAETVRAHADTIAGLTPAQPEPRAAGRPSGDPVPASGIQVTEPPLWRTAGEFLRDYIAAIPNPMNEGQVEREAAARIHRWMETRANQTTPDTPGLLPEQIIGQIMTDIDESRPFVQSLGAKPLGNITGKTFHRPVVTQHTLAGNQATELTDLPSRQLQIDPVPFVKTTAGASLKVSRQDIDWSDPAAWQAILDDMAGSYAEYTDDVSATGLGVAVLQTTAVAEDTLDGYVDALYQGAYQALTANGTMKARARRIPDVVWTAPDMWATIGAAIDKARAQVRPEITGLGSGGVGTVNGSILDLPRIMVPGLNAGTAIIGSTRQTEFYEQRIGLLQAVLPSAVGVELAVPGYIAYGTLDATCFCKITAPTP